MKITSCYQCQERHEACWSSCEKYQAQRAAFKKQAEAERNDSLVRSMYYDRWARRVKYLQEIRGKVITQR